VLPPSARGPCVPRGRAPSIGNLAGYECGEEDHEYGREGRRRRIFPQPGRVSKNVSTRFDVTAAQTAIRRNPSRVAVRSDLVRLVISRAEPPPHCHPASEVCPRWRTSPCGGTRSIRQIWRAHEANVTEPSVQHNGEVSKPGSDESPWRQRPVRLFLLSLLFLLGLVLGYQFSGFVLGPSVLAVLCGVTLGATLVGWATKH
jgi:hypothetical protein